MNQRGRDLIELSLLNCKELKRLRDNEIFNLTLLDPTSQTINIKKPNQHILQLLESLVDLNCLPLDSRLNNLLISTSSLRI